MPKVGKTNKVSKSCFYRTKKKETAHVLCHIGSSVALDTDNETHLSGS